MSAGERAQVMQRRSEAVEAQTVRYGQGGCPHGSHPFPAKVERHMCMYGARGEENAQCDVGGGDERCLSLDLTHVMQRGEIRSGVIQAAAF